MSPYHFHRVFTKIVGLTPKGYANARRAHNLRQQLPKRASVTEAIYEAGFNSNSRFYEKASELLGMQPLRYRQGGSGETIRFAVVQCSLGLVLAGSSDKGICAIFLGDDPDALAKDLRDRFPKAILTGADAGFEQVVSRVVELVERPQLGCDLPLDVRGTAFQQQVWQALRTIPAGQTLTYAEIAHRIGMPKAVRAVGNACAQNKIAIAIPCHRALRTDGALSGYRWGTQRKRALLKKEQLPPR